MPYIRISRHNKSSIGLINMLVPFLILVIDVVFTMISICHELRRKHKALYKCICITGSEGGLGRQLLAIFMHYLPNAHYVLLDNQAATTTYGNNVQFYKVDITQHNEIDQIFSSFPNIDLLVSYKQD